MAIKSQSGAVAGWDSLAIACDFSPEAPSVRFVKSEPFAQNAIRRARWALPLVTSVLEQKL